MKKLNILYALNNEYQFTLMKISILSIIKNTNKLDKLHFNIVYYGDLNFRDGIEKFLKKLNCNFSLINISDLELDERIKERPVLWWIWCIHFLKNDSYYTLQLDNDTIINCDIYDLVRIDPSEINIINGVQYGSWGPKFYEKNRTLKRILKDDKKIKSALNDFFNTGVVLIKNEEYIRTIDINHLNSLYDAYYKSAKKSLFFTSWTRRNDEIFVLCYLNEYMSIKINSKYNLSVHSTPPNILNNHNDYILHLFWPKKLLIYDFILGNIDEEKFKNEYVNIWKKGNLNGIKIKSSNDYIYIGFEKLYNLFLETKKLNQN